MQLVGNAAIILTKNNIVQKAIQLLQQVQLQVLQQTPAGKSETAHLFTVAPKISKGENYEGLPYAVLDYPRIAQNGAICFIRSMFWWGNYFSSTLQLSGVYKTQHVPEIARHHALLAQRNYFVGVSTDPWKHHFSANNYVSIKTLSPRAFEAALQEQAHTKIAAKWPLLQWNQAANTLCESWQFLAGLIT